MNKLLKYVAECDEVVGEGTVILEGDVQESVSQAEEAGSILDKAFDEIQSANKAIDSLYRVANVVKDSVVVSEGQETLVSLTEVAIEQIYESLDMQLPQTLSMEADFMEGVKTVASKIKDHAIRIMAAIIEAFRKAIDWIGDFINRVSDAAGKLESKAKTLSNRLSKVTRGQPRNTSFKDSNLSRALSGGEDLIKRYKEVSELVKDTASVAFKGEHIALLNKIIEEFVNSQNKDVTAVLKLVTKLPEVLDKAYGNIFKHTGEIGHVTDPYVREGTSVYTTSLLPGGYVGIMTVPNDLDSLKYLNFVIRRDDEASSKDAGDGTMKTLDASEIKSLLDTAIGICSDISTFHHLQSALKMTSVKLTKAAEMLKKNTHEMDKGHREVLGAIAIVAPYIAKGIHSRVFGFATSCSNAVINYCQKSIDQYEKLT